MAAHNAINAGIARARLLKNSSHFAKLFPSSIDLLAMGGTGEMIFVENIMSNSHL